MFEEELTRTLEILSPTCNAVLLVARLLTEAGVLVIEADEFSTIRLLFAELPGNSAKALAVLIALALLNNIDELLELAAPTTLLAEALPAAVPSSTVPPPQAVSTAAAKKIRKKSTGFPI